ncbi:MAG: helix-turn-helix domain-containing protein [Rhodospirillaceae bacterium]|nr:helix-turn-helix domain-containing protein [Rhodospirillaceae bacterium]
MKRKTSNTRDSEQLRAFIASAPHVISILVYPGCSSYEVSAPGEVFSTANGQLRRELGIDKDVYALEVVTSVPGVVEMEMGVKMLGDRTITDPHRKVDTLLLSGACLDPVQAAVANKDVIAWIQKAAPKARRIASMCTGAFLLAEAGLATGNVTTHWAHCELLRKTYPDLKVNADNIYIRDGNIYSSAGSTSVMDLALALVEEDLGRKLAMNVARRLVMFLKRPGGQSQFSTALLAQTQSTDALKDLPEWIADNLDEDLSVEALAERVGMSPRNFARVFTAETKLTPAKYVERARLERARQLIEETKLPLLSVAAKAGFESDQQLRRTFVRWLGVTPAEYLDRFRNDGHNLSVPVITTGLKSAGTKGGTFRGAREELQPWLP